jgi:hypothetical protein
MVAKKLFVGCVVLFILGRTVHCLYLDASLCALAATNSETQPVTDPTDSDPNETGCICKGALLRVSCLLAELQQQSKLISPALLSPAPTAYVPQWCGDSAGADFLRPLPCSGKALRALLASWQV